MPRETISINLSSLPAYEAAANFLSYIAFPDKDDATRRETYRVALLRWAIIRRAELDYDWARSTQDVRPSWFTKTEKVSQKFLDHGFKILTNRVLCAGFLILPHVGDEPQKIEGFLSPTVANVSKYVSKLLGSSEGSAKTLQNRVWRPAKPVAHAAAAIMAWFLQTDEMKGHWQEDHHLVEESWFLGILFYTDVLKWILQISEYLRMRLPGFSHFLIREEDTIQFIAH